MLTVAVDSAGVERALATAARMLGRPRPLLAKLGKSLEKELRGHFLARDKEGNSHGWPSKHFWNREIRANTALTSATDEQATVTVASPAFGQKLYGGTIRAKRGRFLAIPARQEAYAAGSPREGGMQGLFRPKGRRFLMDREGLVQYWLVERVTQAKDPRALPDMDAVGNRLAQEAEAWVAKKFGSAMA